MKDHDVIIEKLKHVVETQKAYKDPDISLNDLADAIRETRNSISAVLNNTLNLSFYDYLNKQRIEESKRLLTDKKLKNYTIEAIALESGFKTMSVFYRFFKDTVQVTPSEFRKCPV
jgi:YesN/AraC family two-component response regulator